MNLYPTGFLAILARLIGRPPRRGRRGNRCPHWMIRYVHKPDWLGRPYRDQLVTSEEQCLSDHGHPGKHIDRYERTWT